ncbi:MAG: site-2 protease family protein [Oscillospiraceae bacterium]|nr:site-2 protease family protein [Oscillospiraceae bacterium]
MLLYVIVAVFVFGLLIFLHELGHFIAAKACGVRVNEFSVCMGPALWQKTKGETTYSLRLIPIGGYCAMEGEDDASDDPRSFTAVSVWKRLCILVAGAGANFLCGLLILLILFGTSPLAATPTIREFYPESTVAEETGLQVGDTLYRIDGRRVYRYEDVGMLLDRSIGLHTLEVLRDGKRVSLGEVPLERRAYIVDGEEQQMYGLQFAVVPMTLPLALSQTWANAADFVRLIWMSLGDLIHGLVGFDQISGTVGIVRIMAQTGEAAETTAAAVRSIAYFAAFLAINLAVMNLLPIPALDGGKVFTLLVTAVLETVFRRKIDPKYEQYIHAAGMVLLLVLIAVITLKDILAIFR